MGRVAAGKTDRFGAVAPVHRSPTGQANFLPVHVASVMSEHVVSRTAIFRAAFAVVMHVASNSVRKSEDLVVLDKRLGLPLLVGIHTSLFHDFSDASDCVRISAAVFVCGFDNQRKCARPGEGELQLYRVFAWVVCSERV